mgnify:CR=1 FL=1
MDRIEQEADRLGLAPPVVDADAVLREHVLHESGTVERSRRRATEDVGDAEIAARRAHEMLHDFFRERFAR